MIHFLHHGYRFELFLREHVLVGVHGYRVRAYALQQRQDLCSRAAGEGRLPDVTQIASVVADADGLSALVGEPRVVPHRVLYAQLGDQATPFLLGDAAQREQDLAVATGIPVARRVGVQIVVLSTPEVGVRKRGPGETVHVDQRAEPRCGYPLAEPRSRPLE